MLTRKEQTDMMHKVLDELSGEMLRNNAYDNRLPILKKVEEIINMPIDWEKDGTKPKREMYNILIQALPQHLNKWKWNTGKM